MIDALLPVRLPWQEGMSWASYVMALAAANGVSPMAVAGVAISREMDAPTDRGLERVHQLSGVSVAQQRLGLYRGRYPHHRPGEATLRAHHSLRCPGCPGIWRVEWHSPLVVTCRSCEAVLAVTSGPWVTATPDLLTQQERIAAALDDPDALQRRRRLLTGARRLARCLTASTPVQGEFDALHRPEALALIAASRSGWRTPLAMAVLMLHLDEHVGDHASYQDFFTRIAPTKSEKSRFHRIWCQNCGMDPDRYARSHTRCTCSDCGRLLTRRHGYHEDDVDQRLVGTETRYLQARAAQSGPLRRRAARTTDLLAFSYPLLSEQWPLPYRDEPPGRRRAALTDRGEDPGPRAWQRLSTATLLPHCWEAATTAEQAARFMANAVLNQLTDGHPEVPAHATVPGLRSDLRTAIREAGTQATHIPGRTMLGTTAIAPSPLLDLACAAVSAALTHEVYAAWSGRPPPNHVLRDVTGPVAARALRIARALTRTRGGLSYLMAVHGELVATPATHYGTDRKMLAAMRDTPKRVTDLLSCTGVDAEVASQWIWLDATGATGGGPALHWRLSAIELDARLTPEDRLTLRLYGQSLVSATAELLEAPAAGAAPSSTSGRQRDVG